MSGKILSTIELVQAEGGKSPSAHLCIESAFVDAVRPFSWPDDEPGYEIAFHCNNCFGVFVGRIRVSDHLIPSDLIHHQRQRLIVATEIFEKYFPQIKPRWPIYDSESNENPAYVLGRLLRYMASQQGLDLAPDFESSIDAMATYYNEPVQWQAVDGKVIILPKSHPEPEMKIQ